MGSPSARVGASPSHRAVYVGSAAKGSVRSGEVGVWNSVAASTGSGGVDGAQAPDNTGTTDGGAVGGSEGAVADGAAGQTPDMVSGEASAADGAVQRKKRKRDRKKK
ncbi:hypothetical protein Pmani_016351 [Petrolisthes manimaculis]|uniref:Uncharacterized protein n=1 Tax=Petrolisthes manimaculis TaxID=1843537 RepID=A0AAE1U6G7_9EUCA|nr:hypothetical protein Pmani_016351 [Petrolisthes manimaculis]